MLKYELGEMRTEEGYPLRFEVEISASNHAIKIMDRIKHLSAYRDLTEKLQSPRLHLYFESLVRNEIYAYIRQACVIDWYKAHGKPVSHRDAMVVMPDHGIFYCLLDVWGFQKAMPILSRLNRFSANAFVVSNVKGYVKKQVFRICDIIGKNTQGVPKRRGCGTIACHYTEGIDPSRRNDLVWYSKSGVSPDRVLVYFDSRFNAPHHVGRNGLIKKDVIRKIEKSGLRWVALERGLIEGQGEKCWRPPKVQKGALLKSDPMRGSLERWVAGVGNEFLRQVYYWRAFYDEFNVRINYVLEEGSTVNIAQAIAFDIKKNEEPGFLLGKQRSEAWFPPRMLISYHPKHIYFTWNNRAHLFSGTSYDHIEQFVVSGYPYEDHSAEDSIEEKGVRSLKHKGADFVVAICDNVCGPGIQFSVRQMEDFYAVFIDWMLKDDGVGIVIKSKKPHIIQELTSLRPSLHKALLTGRCLIINQASGPLPLNLIDMVVGIGISTVTTESIIRGARGVHYDITQSRYHDYYKWGYGRLVFDDLAATVNAIKKFRSDTHSSPSLGDWSDVIGRLDPFCDNRGGHRIGVYIRSLLDALEGGKGHDEAIAYANTAYSARWGADKIIKNGRTNEAN